MWGVGGKTRQGCVWGMDGREVCVCMFQRVFGEWYVDLDCGAPALQQHTSPSLPFHKPPPPLRRTQNEKRMREEGM